MARYIGSVCRLCRREGEKLFLKGSRCMTPKCAFEKRGFPPGQHGREKQFRRGRASDYLMQLREKQKARRIYGIFERQFSRYFVKAVNQPGVTGTNLLILLESRLDNVIYRLGLAESRIQARQLVQHGHFTLNGQRTNVPSAQVKPGMVIAIYPRSTKRRYFKDLKQNLDDRQVPKWLSLDLKTGGATVLSLPKRDDIDVTLNEQVIVEYYSR